MSFRTANWGYWLVTLGAAAMGLILSAHGLMQGFMLMSGVEFMDSVNAMRPYWWARTLSGVAMDVGVSLLVLTLVQTSRGRRPA